MESYSGPDQNRRLPENLKGASVLVTGGTGTTGKLLVRWLLEESGASRVIVYSRDEQKHHDLLQDQRFQHPAFRSVVGDIRDLERLRHSLRDVDLVLHTAAMKHVAIAEANPTEAVQTNILGTMNLIEAATSSGVSRVIAHSTDKAVQPACIYGASKLMMEKLLIRANAESGPAGPRFDIVRHGNLVGSRGSVIPLFREQIKSGLLTVTNPAMTRFWINGNELVNIVYRTILEATGGEIFIPKIAACRLDTLVETIAPNTPIKIIGPRPGEKKHEALTSPEEASRIHEFGSYMVVFPENYPEKRGAAPPSLPEGYQYRSDQVPLLDASQMGEYLQENSQVEPA